MGQVFARIKLSLKNEDIKPPENPLHLEGTVNEERSGQSISSNGQQFKRRAFYLI